jgi:hypothetical protein
MDYKETLSIVKKQNPEMPHKEAVKKASEMYKRFQKAQETYGAGNSDFSGPGGSAGGPTSSVASGVVTNELANAEKKLRSNVIDVNSLRTIGREAIPDGELVQHGKDGVNTMVSFENKTGKRLPLVGYFRIYI